MELIVGVLSGVGTAIVFIYTVYRNIKTDQMKHRAKLENRLSIMEKKSIENSMNIKQIDRSQEKFESRIEHQLQAIQDSMDKLNEHLLSILNSK